MNPKSGLIHAEFNDNAISDISWVCDYILYHAMPPSIDFAATAGGTRRLHKTIISVNNEKGQKSYSKLRSMSASSSSQSVNSPTISIPIRQRSASSDSFPCPKSGNSIVVGQNEARTRRAVRKLSSFHRTLLTDVFTENLEEYESKLTILEFKSIFQFKGDFSVQRVFNILTGSVKVL